MKTCPECGSTDVFTFDADNDACKSCQKWFPAVKDVVIFEKNLMANLGKVYERLCVMRDIPISIKDEFCATLQLEQIEAEWLEEINTLSNKLIMSIVMGRVDKI